MFAETYTKFFSFMALSLVLGFVAIELVTSGGAHGRLSGMATSRAADAGPGLTAESTPGTNIVFLLVGICAGMVLLGSAMYIYSIERKKIV